MSKAHPWITGINCPRCGGGMFVGSGGYITCSFIECPNPDFTEVYTQMYKSQLAMRSSAKEPPHPLKTARSKKNVFTCKIYGSGSMHVFIGKKYRCQCGKARW